MQNLFPNGGAYYTGPGLKFGYWTATVVTGTVLVHTYSATTGPDSTPGVTCSCTGTSATLSLVSSSFNVPADEGFLVLGLVAKASNTGNSTLIPFQVAYTDALGNAIITHTPIASAAAGSTSAIQYSAVSTVPVAASTAVVTLGAYNWTSTGGYNIVYSSPSVMVA